MKIIIIIYFDFKIKWYNVINIFIYVLRQLIKLIVIYYILNGFFILRILIEVK